MKRLWLLMLVVVAPVAPSLEGVLPASTDRSAPSVWGYNMAFAQTSEISAKEAFEAAKELGTVEAWEAFLRSFPTGFYADLARAYLKKLSAGGAAPPQATTQDTGPKPEPSPDLGDLAPTDPGKAAVTRGGRYMGFAERFNRYYTDPAWKPSKIIYVSPNGNGDGASRNTPMSAPAAVAAARPGTRIYFVRGKYQGCFEFSKETSGTYDDPIVLFAERNEDKSLGVALTCCSSGRQTCFNFEDADYIAVDGFELIGGRYGVRAIGAGYAASQHSRGIAVIDCKGHDQDRDPFFSGQSDWAVWERNVAHGAKTGDGHGIYLSNGGDWNIVRYNETYGNVSSDFQINADPDFHLQAGWHPVQRPALRRLCRHRRRRPGRERLLPRRLELLPPRCRPRLRRELHERAQERGPQQHLRLLFPARGKLLAGDGQSEARLERQQDPSQPVRHHRPPRREVREKLDPQRIREQCDPRCTGERRPSDGEPVGAVDGGRRHGWRERVPLEPLRLGQDRRAHSERR